MLIVGILFQDAPEAGLQFHTERGGTWPTVYDEESRTALAFGVYGIPETYFIRPDGSVAGRQVGLMGEETLIAGIEAIRIAGELRCPVCQALSVRDSPSETARAIREEIARRVAEGRTDEEIVREFRDAYGDWILLAPPVADARATIRRQAVAGTTMADSMSSWPMDLAAGHGRIRTTGASLRDGRSRSSRASSW